MPRSHPLCDLIRCRGTTSDTCLLLPHQYLGASLQATATNPEVLAIADDPMCAMGSRVNMSASRLTGGQAWVRPLSDGSRAVVLLNAGVSPLPVDTCTWNHTVGGYWQTLPISPAGNLYCSNSDTPESLKARCCAAGRGVCASIAYDLGQGDACLKRNDDSGWVTDARFADWKVIGGQPDPPTPAPEQVCVSMVAAGLNPYKVQLKHTMAHRAVFASNVLIIIDSACSPSPPIFPAAYGSS